MAIRTRAVLALLTAALMPAGAFAEDAAPNPAYEAVINQVKVKLGKEFTVHRVGVFVVAWDLDADEGAKYEDLIQREQDALYAKFFVNKPTGIYKVALFKDTASLQKNAKKLAEKSAVMQGGGFYLPYERVICVDTTMGPWVVQHEETHALLHSDFRRDNWPSDKLTPWIDEGMAMLVESAVIKDKDLEIRVDWRLRAAAELIKAQKMPALKDVFKMDFATYNSFQNRMNCDVVSRNFLLYLHEKGQLMAFYKLYRGNYSSDPTGVKFIEQVTKQKLDAVEADWLRWIEEKNAKPGKGEEAPREERAAGDGRAGE